MSAERDWDFDKMEIVSVDRGFVLGVGIVGETPLGGAGETIDLRDVFTGMTINARQSVEADMFLHPDVVTLGLSANQKDAPNYLENASIRVTYDGLPLFYGQILDYEIRRVVDVSGKNPKQRKYSSFDVSLQATNKADRFARTQVNIQGLPEASIGQRLIDAISFLSDVDIEFDGDGLLTDKWRTESFAAGPSDPTFKTAKALVSEAEVLLGAIAYYDQEEPQKLRFRPVGGGSAPDAGWVDTQLSSDRSRRGQSVSGMTVTSAQDSEVAYYAMTTDDPARNDQSISIDVPSLTEEALMRFVNGLPLIPRGRPGVVECEAPFRKDMVFDGTLMPSRITFNQSVGETSEDEEDYITSDSYPVIGVVHSISQKRWRTALTLGQTWMLSTEGYRGTRSPSRPQEVAYASGEVTFAGDPSEPNVIGWRVCARTNRYPLSPTDYVVTEFEPVYDYDGAIPLTLPSGTWYVSIFAMTVDAEIWSYPSTLDAIVIP